MTKKQHFGPRSCHILQVVVSNECLKIAGDCCRGTRLPSNNLLLESVQPPRREKRGSVRVATMIANKGLPIELEPVEGVEMFGGMGASNAESPDTSPPRESLSPLAVAAAAAAKKYEGGDTATTRTRELGRAAEGAGLTPKVFKETF